MSGWILTWPNGDTTRHTCLTAAFAAAWNASPVELGTVHETIESGGAVVIVDANGAQVAVARPGTKPWVTITGGDTARLLVAQCADATTVHEGGIIGAGGPSASADEDPSRDPGGDRDP